MNTKEAIEDYLTIISSEGGEETARVHKLMKSLDELAFAASDVTFVFDEKEYPDPPKLDPRVLRQLIETSFPTLGNYNTASNDSDKLDHSTWLMGDAIDDLVDIAIDLMEVKWRMENTSEPDALFYFELLFRSHWGLHLRSLQLYLHEVF